MPAKQFDGTRVVLTGVGREGQVGEAIAAAFAAEGASLLLVDRNQSEVEARAATLAAAGATVTAIPCDLSDEDQVAKAAARIAAGGKVGALVHIAGGFAMSGAIGDSDPRVLDRMLLANLTTAYMASRGFVPLIGDGGAVVYFATSYVIPGSQVGGMSAYLASKSAVVGLMRTVADEGRARHLRANAVAPIAVRTGDKIRDMGAGARYVEREAVADAVVFLCSHAARAITGQVLLLTD